MDILAIITIASWSAALALFLDELYDGRTHPEHGIKVKDILNPRSHEFVITVLTAIGLTALLMNCL